MEALLAWFSLGVLVVADVVARRRHGPARGAPKAPPPWGVWAVAGLSLGLALLRIPFALGRSSRNVDEFQYAMTAAFARDHGTSYFSWPWNFHGHQLLYSFCSWEEPFAFVDVTTCLVVGGAAFLLGWTVLLARKDLPAALLTVPFFAVGMVRFEGLSSNKEPYVCLFLAGWVLLRLGLKGAGRETWRRVAGGACLGAAAVMKEQALLLVPAEALLLLVEALAREGDSRRRAKGFARGAALAAAGFWAPMGLLWASFARHGQLGDYLSFLAGWGGTGGQGSLVVDEALASSADDRGSLSVLAFGLLPLWVSPVLLLGTAYLLRLLARGRELAKEHFLAGLVALAACAVVAVSVGFRWSNHYWMLVFPALAPLAALRLRDGLVELKSPPHRLGAMVLALLLLFTGALEVLFLASAPGQSDARGGGLQGEEREQMELIAAEVKKQIPPGKEVFVWGWRPELYVAADRRPASRYVGGVTAGMPEVLVDLRARPPALILSPPAPGWPDDPTAAARDPYALSRHPALKQLMDELGYRQVAAPDHFLGWSAWGRVPPRAPPGAKVGSEGR